MSLLVKMTSLYESKYFTIILILSVSTLFHLYNVTGFPTIHIDEGTYMYRAMHFLTFGNVEWNHSFYDHPYFGPVMLGSIFKIFNFPHFALSNIQFQGLMDAPYTIPRIMMGLFAVIDTFLIYAISKKLYGRNVGIISSLLFSVLPFTWALRRIYLESILLPLLLSSVLLVLYSNSLRKKTTWLLIFFSGVLLGLAIFTKAPLFTMIPFLIILIYKQNSKIAYVILFMIPVIAIPAIWPMDALSKGEIGQWSLGVSSQIARENASFPDAIYDIFKIDPVVFVISIIGILYAVVRRDYFIIFGTIPFLAFFSIFISYVNWFYMIPIFGFVCISFSVVISKILSHFPKYRIVIISITFLIILFGILSTLLLISTDVASFQNQTVLYITTILAKGSTFDESSSNKSELMTGSEEVNKSDKFSIGKPDDLKENISSRSSTTIIASPIYSWVYKFVYSYNGTFYSYTEDNEINKKGKLILVLDRYFRDFLVNNAEIINSTWNQDVGSAAILYDALSKLHSSKYFIGNSIEFDFDQYPYTSMRFNLGGSPVEVRTNF